MEASISPWMEPNPRKDDVDAVLESIRHADEETVDFMSATEPSLFAENLPGMAGSAVAAAAAAKEGRQRFGQEIL